jgi:hypothetical protein
VEWAASEDRADPEVCVGWAASEDRADPGTWVAPDAPVVSVGRVVPGGSDARVPLAELAGHGMSAAPVVPHRGRLVEEARALPMRNVRAARSAI